MSSFRIYSTVKQLSFYGVNVWLGFGDSAGKKDQQLTGHQSYNNHPESQIFHAPEQAQGLGSWVEVFSYLNATYRTNYGLKTMTLRMEDNEKRGLLSKCYPGQS